MYDNLIKYNWKSHDKSHHCINATSVLNKDAFQL
jgi:hypothetical protein